MGLSTIIALLQAALMLLTAAQGPNVPQALHDRAVQVAQQAITQATVGLSRTQQPSSGNSTPPVSTPIKDGNFQVAPPTGSALQSNANFSATPTSGAAPLSVTFSAASAAGAESINYGDGSQECWAPNYEGEIPCNMLSHTYTVPGTYSAILYRHFPTTEFGRATIAVASTKFPLVTIDQNSLTSASWTPTISGTATNLSAVSFSIFSSSEITLYDIGWIAIANGHWSHTVEPSLSLNPGTYTVKVYDSGTTGSGPVLANGILTITTNY
jgi:hypothetical protein